MSHDMVASQDMKIITVGKCFPLYLEFIKRISFLFSLINLFFVQITDKCKYGRFRMSLVCIYNL